MRKFYITIAAVMALAACSKHSTAPSDNTTVSGAGGRQPVDAQPMQAQ